jgi:hypothetical protein
VRFVKAAKVLSPGGTLAVFGHVPIELPDRLRDVFQRIYLRHVGRWLSPPEAWYLPAGPFKGWFDESGLFGPVEHRCYSWIWRHNSTSYIDFLRTRSDHRMLAAEQREQLLTGLAEAIDAQGGRLDIDYETHLYMARLIRRLHLRLGCAPCLQRPCIKQQALAHGSLLGFRQRRQRAGDLMPAECVQGCERAPAL